MNFALRLATDIFDLLQPRCCDICGRRLAKSERCFCAKCLMHLPLTLYHTLEHNPLEKKFWGRFPIRRAAAMLFYDGVGVRRNIHELKYHKQPRMCECLVDIYVEELMEAHFFDDIDALVPVPLHWRRHLKRGYNQSELIAQRIARQTGLPVWSRVVKRAVNNVSQTQLDVGSRMDNAKDIFRVLRPDLLVGKHVLLIDDVITTGSTIASCACELAKVPNVSVSVFSIAVSSNTVIPVAGQEYPDVAVSGTPLIE